MLAPRLWSLGHASLAKVCRFHFRLRRGLPTRSGGAALTCLGFRGLPLADAGRLNSHIFLPTAVYFLCVQRAGTWGEIIIIIPHTDQRLLMTAFAKPAHTHSYVQLLTI